MGENTWNIKILVSHRIDVNSVAIENPLYMPVLCGATFDAENSIKISGDDTGDNISARRMSFCEFTVQYWAWKNIEADYYGLCHYRRYLSFAKKHFKTNKYNMIHVPALTQQSKKRFGLLNNKNMERLISEYDILVSEYAETKNIPTPRGKKATVREMWEAHEGFFFKKDSINLMFELIDQMAPTYSHSAREYFSGSHHRGFNCYILRGELFNRLCQFQFPIMFEVERRLDTKGYSQTMLRTPAFLGEMLYGIFIHHVTKYEQWKARELQLIFFNSTEQVEGRVDLIKRYLWFGIEYGLRAIIDSIMPIGTKRRAVAKRAFYSVVSRK